MKPIEVLHALQKYKNGGKGFAMQAFLYAQAQSFTPLKGLPGIWAWPFDAQMSSRVRHLRFEVQDLRACTFGARGAPRRRNTHSSRIYPEASIRPGHYCALAHFLLRSGMRCAEAYEKPGFRVFFYRPVETGGLVCGCQRLWIRIWFALGLLNFTDL